MLIIVCVALLGLITFLPGNGEKTDISNFLFLMIFAVLFLLILPLTLLFRSSKVYDSDQFLQEEQNYSVGKSGITVSAASSNAQIGWNKIHKITETPHYLYIYLARNKAFIVPKASVGEKLEQLKARFRESVDRSRLKLK